MSNRPIDLPKHPCNTCIIEPVETCSSYVKCEIRIEAEEKRNIISCLITSGREIKFRAWDKNLKRIRTDISIPSDYTERNGDLDLLNMFKLLARRYDFMQYTGLKDKNGKEVYEGDILEISGLIGPVKTVTTHVIWYNGAFRLDGFYDVYICEELRNIRILGNIYENYELLSVNNA